MKFIGQYIQDFIARFRSDVYLEDVSTGTIASGANLGLDSNNKVVKNTVSGGTTDLTSDVTGVLPIANGGTNSNSAANARTALGVDAAGTDNSTNVTLAGSLDYITLSGQEITRNAIALADDVSGFLPVANGGTAANNVAGARASLGVDAAGTDNSTNVTLAGTPDYITISGQEITRNQIDLANDVTGTLPSGNVATLNQDTTGSAATLTTPRAINGVDFDGSAPITITAAGSTLSDTVTVGKGGTGATTLTSNAILTGNGTSAIQAEAGLTYNSEILLVGNDDDGIAQIRRNAHSDDNGGDLYLRGGDATAGQTDKDGGILRLYGGRGTSNGDGGGVSIFTSFATGSTGTVLHTNARSIASFRADGTTLLTGNLIFEGPVIDGNDTTFSITEQTANRTITVPDSSGTMALTGVNYTYQYISFTGNSTVPSDGDWITVSANGISNHSWNVNLGSGGTTVGSSTVTIPTGNICQGIIVPYDCVLVGYSSLIRSVGNHQSKVGLAVGVPTYNDFATFDCTLRAYNAADISAGPDTNYSQRPVRADYLTANHSMSAGHVIFPLIGSVASNSRTVQWNCTLVLKTLLP